MKQNELDSLYIWQEWHVCLQATDIRTLALTKEKFALKKVWSARFRKTLYQG